MDPALAEALASIEWPKPAEIEYRIYYDPESGTVLDYTNEQRPGHWIVTATDLMSRCATVCWCGQDRRSVSWCRHTKARPAILET